MEPAQNSCPRLPGDLISHSIRVLLSVLLLLLLAGCNLPSSAIPPQDPPSTLPASTLPAVLPGQVIDPLALQYLGAFALPTGGERPRTFEYGGNAMTVNPSGDPQGAQDGFPGSLFITGHDRLPYGDLPDGSLVAEVDIPAPSGVRDPGLLPRASFLQGFSDVTRGHFTRMEEIVRTGLLYLDHPATGPLLHIAWGQHIEPDPTAPTHGWFQPDLSDPEFAGEWFLDGQSWYSINDYLFEIPFAWAEAYTQGRVIAAGRFKDGGWSGMGPVLIAYRPWDQSGDPPADGAALEASVLLRYADLDRDRQHRAQPGGVPAPGRMERRCLADLRHGRLGGALRRVEVKRRQVLVRLHPSG